MNKISENRTDHDIARFCVFGLVMQSVLLILILLTAFFCKCPEYSSLYWNCLAGIPVWLISYLRLRLLYDTRNKASRTIIGNQFTPSRLLPAAELFFSSILLVGGAISLWQSTLLPENVPMSTPLLRNLLFSGILTFIIMVAAFFWHELIRKKRNPELHSGALCIIALAWLGGITTLGIGGSYLHLQWAPKLVLWIGGGFNILIGMEALVRICSRVFLPARQENIFYPAYQSYFYVMLSSPGSGWQTFTDVLSHQFGLDISRGIFLSTAKSLFIPFLFFLLFLLSAASSIVILEPSEKAVVLRFGQLNDRILGPGLHFKSPWPIESVRVYNIWKVNSFHVGSHLTRTVDDGVYQRGVPILWTNQHGVTPDELLIVAPPADLMDKTGTNRNTPDDSRRKAPSISLAAIDITVEYRINDIDKYISVADNPDRYFRELSEQAVSFAVCRFDIDTLFSQGRIGLVSHLKNEIQNLANNANLGLEVVHVGLGGVHPPQDVAAAFQETVTARQEKETSIQSARRYAVRNMIETAGSITNAENILTAVENEQSSGKEKLFSGILTHAEGYVAQTMAEAYAYRWYKENHERGKAERFKSELMTYHNAPMVYLYGCYLNVLDAGLRNANKYILVSDRKNLILRFDMKKMASFSGQGMSSGPGNRTSGYYKQQAPELTDEN